MSDNQLTTAANSPATPAEIIRSEANFLQFPFFALGTKGLKTHSGITVELSKRIDDETHRIQVRIRGNDDYGHPGPLSRKIHHALMAKLQREQKIPPFRNPVCWKWAELARLVGKNTCGGHDIQEMKDAIAATHAAIITTNYQLHAQQRKEGRPIRNRQTAYHMYDRYVFQDDMLPDGTSAECNMIWLSDWYLANLNSLYTGPLNYDLWQYLTNDSHIASRLFEYFTYNSAAGNSVIKVGYEKLTKFLPIRTEKYLSQAQKQLDGSLELLKRQNVIDDFRWERNNAEQLQLMVTVGAALKSNQTLRKPQAEKMMDSPATNSELVQQFYLLWNDKSDHQPTAQEKQHARKVIAWLGAKQALKLLPKIIKRMRQEFPEAKVFGGSMTFWKQERDLVQQRTVVVQRERRRVQEQQSEEQQRQQRSRQLRSLWNSLRVDEQMEIREAIAGNSQLTRRKVEQGDFDDPAVMAACLMELEQRMQQAA